MHGKCMRQLGNEVQYNQIATHLDEAITCVTGLLDEAASETSNVLELEATNENLQTVFHKYCSKRNALYDCIAPLSNSLNPCLTAEEIESKRVAVDVVKRFAQDIFCVNDGLLVINFFNHHGMDCLNSHHTKLSECVHVPAAKYLFGRKHLHIGEATDVEQCTDMKQIRRCSVNELNQCPLPDAANLYNAIFNIILEETHCQDAPEPEDDSHNTMAEEVKEMIISAVQDKCEAAGHREAFSQLTPNFENTKTCVTDLFKATTEEASHELSLPPTKENLQLVFHKFCSKRTTLFDCIEPFSNTVNLCLSAEELEHKNAFVRVLKRFGDLVCKNDGEQIIDFFNGNGMDCLHTHQPKIIECGQKLYNTIDHEGTDEQQCQDVRTFKGCIVTELHGCEDDKAANLINDIFQIVLEESPCQHNNEI